MTTEAGASIKFFVRGIPRPKGSHNAFIRRRASGAQYVQIVDQGGSPLEDWMMAVRVKAHETRGAGFELWDAPVRLTCLFLFPRLTSHPKRNPPKWKATKPDGDKLLRGVADALTGMLYVDDSRIASWAAEMVYDDHRYGAEIEVSLLEAA